MERDLFICSIFDQIYPVLTLKIRFSKKQQFYRLILIPHSLVLMYLSFSSPQKLLPINVSGNIYCIYDPTKIFGGGTATLFKKIGLDKLT